MMRNYKLTPGQKAFRIKRLSYATAISAICIYVHTMYTQQFEDWRAWTVILLCAATWILDYLSGMILRRSEWEEDHTLE